MITYTDTDDIRELDDPDALVRQKANLYGFAALDDKQLLSLLLDKPPGTAAYRKAEELLNRCGGGLGRLRETEVADLTGVPGIGKRQALRLLAAFELGDRTGRRIKDPVFIRSNIDVVTLFAPLIGTLGYEELWAVYLTKSNRMIERCRLSCGGTSVAPAEVKSVLKQAVLKLASKVILVHNHPTGKPEPSSDDRSFTRKLDEGCRALDILLADHIIIAPAGEHFSFFNAGLLSE